MLSLVDGGEVVEERGREMIVASIIEHEAEIEKARVLRDPGLFLRHSIKLEDALLYKHQAVYMWRICYRVIVKW